MPFTSSCQFSASSFSVFHRSMMQNDELPLNDAISGDRFQENFDNHQVVFGSGDDAVYTPAITLWALISQVFFAAEQRSCKAAVLRVASLWAAVSGRDPRSLSFATTLQLLATNWLLCAAVGVTPELAALGQEAPASETVGHRPGPVEPRKNKRRPKILALMKKPRPEYQAELSATAT